MTVARNILTDEQQRESEEPTRDRLIHPTPCESLKTLGEKYDKFRDQYIGQRTLAWGLFGLCGLFAVYMWIRYDALAESGNTRAVAISAISAKLDGIDKSLERIETTVTMIRTGKP